MSKAAEAAAINTLSSVASRQTVFAVFRCWEVRVRGQLDSSLAATQTKVCPRARCCEFLISNLTP